ncbi:MAG: glycosyltransferase [Bacteroidales bacterium]|nr:glycosyltransferase [Bacteroidales bacterium]
MCDTPLFSVLVANFNNGRYLQEAINSVIEQTYSNWELIIVDDGSTDESHAILNKCAHHKKIRIFYNPQNMGCGLTKRKCVEYATGSLCGFLDADDILLPNALESHIDAHRLNSDISCCFSRHYICDEKLNIISESRILHLNSKENYFEHNDYQPEVFASFKKSIYEKTSGITAILPAAVDQELYFKLEEYAPIYILDKFTYKYRSTPNQISKNSRAYSALLWNLLVRYETATRRSLQLDNPAVIALQKQVSHLSLKLFGDQFNRKELIQLQRTLTGIQESVAYRIGKILISPLSWIRRIKY